VSEKTTTSGSPLTAVHYLVLNDRTLLDQCEVDTFRDRGPGGQKRNKTDSAVRLRHRPTRLSAVAVESRSQHENKAKALKRLRQLIALNMRGPIDLDRYTPGATVADCISPSAGLRLGRRDHRYHQVIAEVLDVLDACGCRVAAAAEKLGVSTSNLVSFFRKDPKLWTRVNEMRAAAGLAALRYSGK
jgi:hypothetical protein